ncbi:TldD/PmbA family protein [bacterium]|nr:TldD/PmbA family protein [bacterium]
MREQKRIIQNLEAFLEQSPVADTEVIYNGWTEATTRFAHNIIHQNVSDKNSSVTIRTMEDGHIGVLTTNQLDQTRVRDVIARVVTRMRENPRMEPEYVLRGAEQYRALHNFSEQTAHMTADHRASIVEAIIHQVTQAGLMAAGALVTGYHITSIVNSKGLRAYHRRSTFELTLTLIDNQGGSGWTIFSGSNVDGDCVQDRVNRCIQRTLATRNPQKIEPGRYTVILEPPATGVMLEFLGYLAFSAKEYLRGRSVLSDRLGQAVTGKHVTIHDDAYHPLTTGIPFDYEGAARQKVTLIDKGVATGLVHDSLTARTMNTVTTGHSLPQPNTIGPLPLNLVMDPGQNALEHIIAQTDNGILVTRFHYNRVVDRKNSVLTGLTRDGTFAIRNGEIAFPINNLRYNTNILEAFSRIEHISSEHYLVGEYAKVVAPALKLDDFLFTDVSDH